VSNVANLSDTAANAEANALAALCNGGTLCLYSGSQPANANTALEGNTMLATLTFGSPAWGAAAGGEIVANPIGAGVGVASGTATFARIFEAGGTVVVMDLSVGTANAGLILSTSAIIAGSTVTVSSLTHTVTET
jgi:hypothetical protein